MKIGDKVRFLNSVGGGIIKEKRGKDIIVVEDEDGFDVPVLARECVVIESVVDVELPKPTPQSAYGETPRKEMTEVVVEETPEGESITAVLAFLPVEEKKLSSTSYEAYLVNDSNYFLSYSYLSRGENGWQLRSQGQVEPNTKVFMDEFDKSSLNDLEKVCIQFIAYKKDKPFKFKNPYSVELTIDTVKFYKLHSFRENDYFDENALVYPLIRRDLAEREIVISAEEIKQALYEKEEKRRPRIQPIHKKDTAILEVDLHIEQLLDNLRGLSSSDMLHYQLAKFNEIMVDNLKNKGQKIVFIHGKGDGVLKKAIYEELNKKYKSAYIQDASFREYGFGATMVTIK
jgi:hypothetical protein